jgi:hypothetical protein
LRAALQEQAGNDSPDIALARKQFRRISADGILLAYPHAQYQPIHQDQVERAKVFLATLTVTKRPRVSSYELKHLAEYRRGYISNGAMICAAISLGIPVRSAGGDFDWNPNCLFAVRADDVKRIATKFRW